MDVELQISKDSLAQLVSAAGARETPLDVSTPEACTLAQVHSTECWGGIKKDLNKAGNPKSIVLAALSQPAHPFCHFPTEHLRITTGLDDHSMVGKRLPQPRTNRRISQGVIEKTHITSQSRKRSLTNNTLTKAPSESLISSKAPPPLPKNHFFLQAPYLVNIAWGVTGVEVLAGGSTTSSDTAQRGWTNINR